MQHPLSEFRTVLEEQLTAWNLPVELAAQIEEHSTPVTFEKGGAIVFLHGASADPVFWLRKGPLLKGRGVQIASVAHLGEVVQCECPIDRETQQTPELKTHEVSG